MINFFVVALLAVWKPVESLEQRSSHPLETKELAFEWTRRSDVEYSVYTIVSCKREMYQTKSIENRRDTMCCCESSGLFWEIYDRIKVN